MPDSYPWPSPPIRSGWQQDTLGLGLLELSGGLRAEQGLARQALPYPEKIHKLTRGRTALSFRVGVRHMVAVELQQDYPISSLHGVGMSAPLNAGAAGKAILAFSSEELITEVLSRPLEPITPRTITDPERLRTELAGVRHLGLCGE